ncbi:MAG: DUF2652 domain-containing protein [Acidimicrobiia bacterium]
MTTRVEAPHVTHGTLLLGDISGYTTFLETVAVAHPEMARAGNTVAPAYPILSDLLNVVVEATAPTFQLEEIEGDAVFAYAPDDRQVGGAAMLLGMVRSAYGAFKDRIEEAMAIEMPRHDCQACPVLPTLELEFLVHHGTQVVQRIAGREKLIGPAVNLVHRLLKNSVTEQTGHRGYLFMTDAAAKQLGLTPGIGLAHTEHYEDVGLISGVVIGLDDEATGAG